MGRYWQALASIGRYWQLLAVSADLCVFLERSVLGSVLLLLAEDVFSIITAQINQWLALPATEALKPDFTGRRRVRWERCNFKLCVNKNLDDTRNCKVRLNRFRSVEQSCYRVSERHR